MTLATLLDLKKLELKIGQILEAERVPDSEKLLKLKVDLGAETRQIIAGLGRVYAPENLVGKQIVVVANLEPKILAGLESQGMLLAADNEGQPVILMPERSVPPGAIVK